MFSNTVENVDQDKEQGHQQSHSRKDTMTKMNETSFLPSRNHLGLDEEADPAGDHEHEAGQVDLYLVLHLLPLQPHLEPTSCVMARGKVDNVEGLWQWLNADVVLKTPLSLCIVQELGGTGHCLSSIVILE